VSEAEAAAPDFHLLLDPEEVPAVARAVRLLLSDEAHQPAIRALAREVLAGLEAEPGERAVLSLPLTAAQMKITHSAVRLLIGDLQRGQAHEREILQRVMGKLPDEHVMRAIEL
jgi:NADPH-dependent ferric siderophore reductase